MPLTRIVSARRRSRERQAGAGRLVAPRNWPRRHPILTSEAAIVLVAALLGIWRPWQPVAICGPGLTEVTATRTCVGLDLGGTELRPGSDPLVPLEKKVSDLDAGITGDFATVVMLENLTPDPNDDSIQIPTVQRDIEGAITAVRQANSTSLARGQKPKIKLLLANLGSDMTSEKVAVAAIEAAVTAQRIGAVTGIEQSLDYTRAAVTDLSVHGIVTIGAVPTADDMSRSFYTDQTLLNYFQVSPTNTEEVKAAMNYIIANNYQHVAVVADQNKGDDYVSTLNTAFTNQQSVLGRRAIVRPLPFDSTPRAGATRVDVVRDLFGQLQIRLCQDHPDLVYFAGRSIDLREFLASVQQAGSCPTPLTSLDVLTGDDGNNLVGRSLPLDGPVRIRVFYTGLAAPNEWRQLPPGQDNPADDYQLFQNAFTNAGFAVSDLDDGDAMMHYDAVLTAAIAIHGAKYAGTAPGTVTPEFNTFDCTRWIPGASGFIAYQLNGHAPYDKAMPIMQLDSKGHVTQTDLAWPSGKPLDSQDPSC